MRKPVILVVIVLTAGLLLSGYLLGQEKAVRLKKAEYTLVEEKDAGTDVTHTYFGPKGQNRSGFPRIVVDKAATIGFARMTGSYFTMTISI